jgi:hypothetical protein
VNKTELLRQLDANHAESLALLADIDPEAVIYEETGWRVKDIVAHVATWDAETLRSFHALRRGSEYSIPDFVDTDDYNAFVAHVRMDEPMERILADWESTRQWMKIIFNAMREDEFDAEMTHPSGRRGTARALAGDIVDHELEHMGHIRTALGVK